MRIAILISLVLFLYADPPWTPDVGIYEGGGKQNETTMGVFGGGNLICAGWNDSRLGTYHVGFGASTDGGQAWRETLMIEPSYPADCDPCIQISATGDIYYFWLSYNSGTMRGDIYLTKSTDWGQTWQPSICVTPNTPSTLDDKPWAAIDGNNVFVTWYDYGGSGLLLFKRSTDYGQTWPGSGIAISSTPNGGNMTTAFRGTDSIIYVGWMSWPEQDVMFNKSTNMGSTWQGAQMIIDVVWDPPSVPFRLRNLPSFNSSQDRTIQYVVFADSKLAANQTDVYFSRSTDQGVTWMTPVRINDTPSPDNSVQFYPWLSVDPQDRLHVVWHDSREGAVSYLAQYYAYSTDFGQTWSQNYRVSDVAATAGTFIGDYTTCASDADYVYAVWCDCRNGSSNPDIFFSKAPNPVQIKEEEIKISSTQPKMILSFPNPFTKRSEIHYWPKDAKLEIYQQDGRKVRTIDSKGVYFIILKKDDQTINRKLVKID